MLLLLVLVAVWWTRRTPEASIAASVAQVASGPADGQLRDSGGQTHGSIRREQHDGVTKVLYALTETTPRDVTQEYHGWLFDSATREYRYAGQLYFVSDRAYGLVYTTEEDISRFSQAVISLESHQQPAAPSNVIVGGVLQEELLTPTPAMEATIAPEPTSEVAPEPVAAETPSAP